VNGFTLSLAEQALTGRMDDVIETEVLPPEGRRWFQVVKGGFECHPEVRKAVYASPCGQQGARHL
jgi:hypothetical protein